MGLRGAGGFIRDEAAARSRLEGFVRDVLARGPLRPRDFWPRATAAVATAAATTASVTARESSPVAAALPEDMVEADATGETPQDPEQVISGGGAVANENDRSFPPVSPLGQERDRQASRSPGGLGISLGGSSGGDGDCDDDTLASACSTLASAPFFSTVPDSSPVPPQFARASLSAAAMAAALASASSAHGHHHHHPKGCLHCDIMRCCGERGRVRTTRRPATSGGPDARAATARARSSGDRRGGAAIWRFELSGSSVADGSWAGAQPLAAVNGRTGSANVHASVQPGWDYSSGVSRAGGSFGGESRVAAFSMFSGRPVRSPSPSRGPRGPSGGSGASIGGGRGKGARAAATGTRSDWGNVAAGLVPAADLASSSSRTASLPPGRRLVHARRPLAGVRAAAAASGVGVSGVSGQQIGGARGGLLPASPAAALAAAAVLGQFGMGQLVAGQFRAAVSPVADRGGGGGGGGPELPWPGARAVSPSTVDLWQRPTSTGGLTTGSAAGARSVAGSFAGDCRASAPGLFSDQRFSDQHEDEREGEFGSGGGDNDLGSVASNVSATSGLTGGLTAKERRARLKQTKPAGVLGSNDSGGGGGGGGGGNTVNGATSRCWDDASSLASVASCASPPFASSSSAPASNTGGMVRRGAASPSAIASPYEPFAPFGDPDEGGAAHFSSSLAPSSSPSAVPPAYRAAQVRGGGGDVGGGSGLPLVPSRLRPAPSLAARLGSVVAAAGRATARDEAVLAAAAASRRDAAAHHAAMKRAQSGKGEEEEGNGGSANGEVFAFSPATPSPSSSLPSSPSSSSSSSSSSRTSSYSASESSSSSSSSSAAAALLRASGLGCPSLDNFAYGSSLHPSRVGSPLLPPPSTEGRAAALARAPRE